MTLKCNSFLKKLSIISYRAVVTLDPRVREDDKHHVISTKVEIQRCGEVKAIKKAGSFLNRLFRIWSGIRRPIGLAPQLTTLVGS
jgi:hypothetical protein